MSLFDFGVFSQPQSEGGNQISLFSHALPQQVIDEALCIGSNHENSRLTICAYFKKDKPDNARFLAEHYGENGAGFCLDGRKYAVWYNAEGIRIAGGESAQGSSATLISWEQAAARIRELLELGRYMPQSELDQVDHYEIHDLADRLLLMFRDIEDEEKRFFPSLRAIYDKPGGFPEAVEEIAGLLGREDSLQAILSEYEAFAAAYQDNPDILRFRFYRPLVLQAQLTDLQREPLHFTAAESYDPQRRLYISMDEIDRLLRGGKRSTDYRLAVYSFYRNHTDRREREDFLKNYHGEYSGYHGGNDNVTYQPGKGVHFSHGSITEPYAKVELKWNAVEKRVSAMIAQGRFLSEDDRAAMPQYEKHQLARNIHTFFENVPQEQPHPYPFGFDYWDAVKLIEPQLDDPARVEEIYQMMVPVWEATPQDDRMYKWRQTAFENLSAFRQGTFTLFAEHKEPAAPAMPPEKAYDLGYGHLGNGLTVWNRLEEEHGDYKTVAHIAPDRTVQFYDEEMPQTVRDQIQHIADTSEMTVSATQDAPVFHTPPKVQEPPQKEEAADPYSKLAAQVLYFIGEFDGSRMGYGDTDAQAVETIAEQLHDPARREEIRRLLQSFLDHADPEEEIAADITLCIEEMEELPPALTPEQAQREEIAGYLEEAGFVASEELIADGIAEYQAHGGEGSNREIAGFIEREFLTEEPDTELLEKAKDLINEFCEDEYNEPADFSDLGNVGLAYTTITDEKIPIQVKGTMDKENSAVRKYLAQRADLIGAIRLPDNTFKQNAGTKVTSDILFLQKRDHITDLEPDWLHLDTDENGIRMNSYFVQHPEMVLGDMVMESTRFGPDSACKAREGADLSELLAEAVQFLQAEIKPYELEELDEEEDRSIPADPNVRNFSYTVVDGQVYYRENSRMHPLEVSVTAENRIRGMIELRECVRRLIDYQTEGYPDADVKEEQAKLNTLYDSFTKKYGLISSRGNKLAFSEDSSYCLLCSLEVLDEDGSLKRKTDMFTKRTIRPHVAVTSVDTASEALAVSIAEKARVDMEYMAQLSGKSPEELEAELSGVIFRNIEGPENPDRLRGASLSLQAFSPVTADEYLSGNVRRKLRMAKAFLEAAPDSQKAAARKQVEALEAVQPHDLGAGEIGVRIGANWVPIDVYQQFMVELLTPYGQAQNRIKILRSESTGQWNITEKNFDRANVKANTTYGTKRMSAYHILEQTLNQKDVRVFDYIEDEHGNKKPVLNKKETAIAQDRQELIKQRFSEWVWKDIDRRERLCAIYNETFNSSRPREYDGQHIRFEGMNPAITLRPHQINAIAHVMYGGNTLLAHEVGAGKTFEMVAAAMEMKRLGLCTKSLVVVPNHLTEQWAAEWLQLYPSANILVATKKDFETQNRKKFCSRIATGDYDAVIIGHSQFEKIPMSAERQQAILQQQIDEILFGIEQAKAQKAERYTVKQMERTRKSLEAKLEKLNDQSRKDDVVTFEQLGVDRLFVDESHYFKKALPASMRPTAFLPGLKTRPVKLSTNLTSRAAKGLRPPKRTFPRSKKKSRSTRPQPNSLKNKRRSRRQDRPDRPQTVFRSR